MEAEKSSKGLPMNKWMKTLKWRRARRRNDPTRDSRRYIVLKYLQDKAVRSYNLCMRHEGSAFLTGRFHKNLLFVRRVKRNIKWWKRFNDA